VSVGGQLQLLRRLDASGRVAALGRLTLCCALVCGGWVVPGLLLAWTWGLAYLAGWPRALRVGIHGRFPALLAAVELALLLFVAAVAIAQSIGPMLGSAALLGLELWTASLALTWGARGGLGGAVCALGLRALFAWTGALPPSERSWSASAARVVAMGPLVGLLVDGYRGRVEALRATRAQLAETTRRLMEDQERGRRNEQALTASRLARAAGRELERSLAKDRSLDPAAVERLSLVLRSVADFGAQRPVAPVELDLRGLVGEAQRLVEPLAAARGVRLRAELGAEPSAVRLDPRAVLPVLVHVLQNAIDASPDGGEVQLSVRSAEGRVGLACRDRGAGLPREVVEHLGEPLAALSSTTGAGLGLAIARQVMGMHGGVLDLPARGERPEPGCLVTLWFPADGAGPAPRSS
jgi:signal transduction histidine kinase